MNSEDIKIGETYNLRIQVLAFSEDFIHARPITPNGEYATTGFLEILHKYAPSFTPIPSEHGTLVPTPKHDPFRPFKAGDVARVVERFGRIDATHTLGALVTVTKDECEFTFVHVKHETGAEGLIPWFYLELITPVKEFVPYSVRHNEAHAAWSIYGSFDLSAVNYFYGERYPYTEESAKAAAEAECARLNEEHRKERPND